MIDAMSGPGLEAVIPTLQINVKSSQLQAPAQPQRRLPSACRQKVLKRNEWQLLLAAAAGKKPGSMSVLNNDKSKLQNENHADVLNETKRNCCLPQQRV